LQCSAWKFDALRQWFKQASDACNQRLGFRRQGWLPWQESHAFEGVHFSMPVTPIGVQKKGMPSA
jgi:hypothetical protein